MEVKISLNLLFQDYGDEEIKLELISQNHIKETDIIKELNFANIKVLSYMGISSFKPYFNIYIKTNKNRLESYLSTKPKWLTGISKY